MSATDLEIRLQHYGDTLRRAIDVAQPPGAASVSRHPRQPRRLSVSLAAAVVVLSVCAGAWLIVRREQAPAAQTSSGVAVAADTGIWLDLPSVPAGLRREVSEVRDSAVCLTVAIRAGAAMCTDLEGQTSATYFPVADPVGSDETLIAVEVRTVFADVDLATFATQFGAANTTDVTATVMVRGHDGILLPGTDRGDLLAWQERPGVIAWIAARVRVGDTETKIVELADSLVELSWEQDVPLPVKAVDLGQRWTLSSNNHPYALIAAAGDQECLAIGYLPFDAQNSGSSPLCTNSDGEVWTGGVIDIATSASPSTPVATDADADAVAGLVDARVLSVRLEFSNGTSQTLPTFETAGFTHRAWGTVSSAAQGSYFSAELVSLDADGNEWRRQSINFVNPVVNVDVVCTAAGATGIVPDVIGLPIYVAAEKLRAAGLIIAQVLSGDPDQIVAAQDPAPGTDRGCGDVQLTVSDRIAVDGTTAATIIASYDTVIAPTTGSEPQLFINTVTAAADGPTSLPAVNGGDITIRSTNGSVCVDATTPAYTSNSCYDPSVIPTGLAYGATSVPGTTYFIGVVPDDFTSVTINGIEIPIDHNIWQYTAATPGPHLALRVTSSDGKTASLG